jgi:hypothetical protein
MTTDRHLFDRLGDQPFVRSAAWYALLLSIGVLLSRLVPSLYHTLNAHAYGEAARALGDAKAVPVGTSEDLPPMLAAVIVSFASVALMLPIAWIYVLTRSKRGFQQSMVQTLMILPVVVAGVITIVKNSVALAFGLAGIVTAVSFRIRLQDTKDAVYIFIAIGVGVACGVQAVEIATALSLAFNVIVALLWWTDFGRAPGALEGAPAEQRLQRAVALANRTQQFISRLDQEILRSLAPEQLASVADRVAQRQAALAGAIEEAPPGPAPTQVQANGKRPLALRVVLASDHPGARALVEGVLAAETKKWKFEGATPAAGGQELRYTARLRKKVPADLLERRVRAAAGDAILHFALAA